MDINGISVLREHGGTTVTLTAFFPKQEELDGSEFARLIDLVKDGAPSFTGAASPAGAAEGPTRARGRRGAAAADAAPSSATASSSTDAGAAPEQGTRRRRGAATEENPSTTSNTASDAAPSGRRARGSTAAPADAANTGSSASPSNEGGRRSRRAAEPEAPKGITDLDLSKAASDAAAIITPAVVTKILEEKGVSRTNDLKGDDRQWFLDELAFEIAEAKKG